MITRRQFFQMAASAASQLLPGVSLAAQGGASTLATGAQTDVLQAVIVPEPSISSSRSRTSRCHR
ncbi:hypothetical protein [Paraburkholderia ferrariae]|uniref:hypothetical protein n=1 Tax=Paraburkholderia ferrariae TaxID=386056 RepID=UPI00048884B4|nr:hypothetical protein [Paraburkholderia ferrariae]